MSEKTKNKKIERTRQAPERRGLRSRMLGKTAALIMGGLSVFGAVGGSLERLDAIKSDEVAEQLKRDVAGLAQSRASSVSDTEGLSQIQSSLGDNGDHIGLLNKADAEYVANHSESPAEETIILLGTVEYTGDMKVERLTSVGPDGREFFDEIDDTPESVTFVNPVIKFTADGMVLTAGENQHDSDVVQATIGPKSMADAFVGDEHPSGPDSRIVINGVDLTVSDDGFTHDRLGHWSHYSDGLAHNAFERFAEATKGLYVSVESFQSSGFKDVKSLSANLFGSPNIQVGTIDGQPVSVTRAPQVSFK